MPNLSRFRQDPSLLALGAVICKRRSELSLSQEQLALAAGLDRSYVGQIERGDNNVTLLNLKRIADALGTTVEKLMMEAAL
ncbi:MAG: helix-turn-helix transcriptional regulator [Burkholderiales bacterium]|nr:helix-turn-helix transcriptional regulator [Burkholderiales bacterium]